MPMPWDTDSTLPTPLPEHAKRRLPLLAGLACLAGLCSQAVAFGHPDIAGQGPSFVRFVGRPPQAGLLNQPLGVAVSPAEDGAIFVVDAGNARIQAFRMSSSPVMGAWGRRGNGPADFWHPSDVAVSPDGRFVYVVDAGQRRVKRFEIEALCLITPACTPVSHEWGGRGKGPGLFQEPTGLAIDRQGSVYVVDRGASEVQVFDPDGTWLRTIGGPGHDSGSLLQPTDAAVAPDGRLWVADTLNDRISVFSPDGKAERVMGDVGGRKFYNPTGIAIAPDGSYIVRDYEPSFLRPRWWRFNAARQLVDQRTFDGYEPASPKRVQGVAFLPNGEVIFANPFGQEYVLFHWPKGKANPEPFAQRGAEFTQFESPMAAALDEQFVAVADSANARVLVLSSEQDYQPVGLIMGDFGQPSGVAVYRSQPGSPFNDAVVYIADSERHTIFIASPRGDLRGRWGNGTPGRADDAYNSPEDVAVDREGNVYIADTGNQRVVRRDPATGATKVIGAGQLLFPSAVAVDHSGMLYVLERGGNNLYAFDREGAQIAKWPQGGALSRVVPQGTTDQYVAPGDLWAPVSLAVDGQYLYVLENDAFRHTRVQVLNPVPGKSLKVDDGVIATFAEAQGPGPGQVSGPRGVAAAPDGRVVVVDTNNHRLQLFSWTSPTPTPTPTDTATATATATDVPPTVTLEPTTPPYPGPSATVTQVPPPPPSPTHDPSSTIHPVPSRVYFPLAARSWYMRR